jgi:hypothetical protein
LVSLALSAPGVFAPNAAYAKPKTTVNVLPQMKTTASLVGTTFNATTKLGGQTYTQPLGLSATPDPLDPTCPILNLDLGPIHLALLGLHVDTSEICLAITAHQGGGLLGDLLCGLSNALSSPIPGALEAFLGGLTPHELNTLLNGLGGIITGALDAVTTTAAPGVPGASIPSVLGTTPGACDILNLSLGPIDLTLLGLEVTLNDCANPPGPVTVDITAVPSDGLLGQLLCDLDNLLNNGGSAQAILNELTAIANEIAALL